MYYTETQIGYVMRIYITYDNVLGETDITTGEMENFFWFPEIPVKNK